MVFFLWKLVSGDFDMSVRSAPPLQNAIGTLWWRAGPRLEHEPLGAPVRSLGPNLPTPENWLLLLASSVSPAWTARSARRPTASTGRSPALSPPAPDCNADTNTTTVSAGLSRTGDVIHFLLEDEQLLDSWSGFQQRFCFPGRGSITRDDWNGQPVQVGIAEATFSANAERRAFYTDFELTGPNVGFGGTRRPGCRGPFLCTREQQYRSCTWTPGQRGVMAA